MLKIVLYHFCFGRNVGFTAERLFEKERSRSSGCSKPHVTVEKAGYKSYTERFNFPGRIDAVNSVTLKARVAGFLKDRLFEEGDIVKKGRFYLFWNANRLKLRSPKLRQIWQKPKPMRKMPN